MDTVIDLEALERSRVFSEEELVYRNDYDYLSTDIQRKVKVNVMNVQGQKLEIVYQPCFFINGGRGSGKTTLLRAVAEKVCSKANTPGERIVHLAEIEPSELAETENFFVHMLGHIQKHLLQAKATPYLTDEQKVHCRNAYSAIQSMSKGVGLLVRKLECMNGSSDAGYMVQQSVDDCVSGAKLKETFATLTDALCKLINADALLVTIDDADMNFNKCCEVVETVRKYLINPRMVFLFAGDLKLYTLVVRGMQLKHFGEFALRHDESHKTHRELLMETLVDQYAMKLFPLENRVELTDFCAVLEKKAYVEYTNAEGKKVRMEIKAYLMDFLEKKLKLTNPDLWIGYIKNLSTRSALQLLAFWCKNPKDKWREGIKKVVEHALIKHQVDYLSIRRGGVHELAYEVITHSWRMGKGVSRAGLLPSDGDLIQQMVSFYLAAEITNCVNDIRGVMLYLLSVFPAAQQSSRSNLRGLMTENRLGGLNLGANCTAMMLPACHLEDSSTLPFGNGVVPLFSQRLYSADESEARFSVQNFVNELSDIVKNNSSEEDVWDVISIASAMSRVVENGHCIYCLSVYNLMDVIAQLLRISRFDRKVRKKRLKEKLNEICVFIPTSVRSDVVEKSGPQDSIIGLGINETINFSFINRNNLLTDKLIRPLEKWLSETDKMSVSAHPGSLQRAWMHFYRDCLIATNEKKMQVVSENSYPKAVELFIRYLEGFTSSMFNISTESDLKLIKLLKECPIIAPWISRKSCKVWEAFAKVDIESWGLPLRRQSDK